MRSFSFSMRAAVRGLLLALREERNARIHFFFIVGVSTAGLWVGLQPWAWCVLFLCFGLVVGAELLNTAVERLCDRVCPEHDELCRDAKDVAAGAVLVCSVISVACGVVIFAGALWRG